MDQPPQIMVFKPTWKEFKDFQKYIEIMESYNGNASVPKVTDDSIPDVIPKKRVRNRGMGGVQLSDDEIFTLISAVQEQQIIYDVTYAGYNTRKKEPAWNIVSFLFKRSFRLSFS